MLKVFEMSFAVNIVSPLQSIGWFPATDFAPFKKRTTFQNLLDTVSLLLAVNFCISALKQLSFGLKRSFNRIWSLSAASNLASGGRAGR